MTNVERLWAPWRSAFVSQRTARRRCIFCAAKRSKADRAHHVVFRGRGVFALLNRYPYNNGHVMVAPYRHAGTLSSLTALEWSEMLAVTRRLEARLTRALRAQGFNIGLNLGKAAGAGIPGHLHLHIVPRWRGDSNYMSVVTDVRIVSRSLEELYTLLATRRER